MTYFNMAVRQITYFAVALFLKQMSWAVEIKLPDEKGNLTIRSHLKHQNVLNHCKHRNETCKSNNTNICAIKVVNHRRFTKDFVNGCFLMMSNMCDHPEEEYYIISSGSCKEYLASRRMDEEQVTEVSEAATESGETTTPSDDVTENETEITTDTTVEKTTTEKYNSTSKRNSTAHALRAFSYSPLYEVEFSYDGHACPFSCPNVYQPVCVNVNRGKGKYFKMFYFINHCASDKYYCANWREFVPPPDEDKYHVRASNLGWSFCGAHRYIQFARFSEVITSMGSYGWLSGNYKYSHIMAPNQVKPGFG